MNARALLELTFPRSGQRLIISFPEHPALLKGLGDNDRDGRPEPEPAPAGG